MKPCKACSQVFGDALCAKLGHCVFEGSGEWPRRMNWTMTSIKGFK